MTARNRYVKWPVWNARTSPPTTLGLSLAEGKTILQAIQEVVVEWQMQAYLGQQRHCPAVWQPPPQQGGASHGLSDGLWLPACRKSPSHPLRVPGP